MAHNSTTSAVSCGPRPSSLVICSLNIKLDHRTDIFNGCSDTLMLSEQNVVLVDAMVDGESHGHNEGMFMHMR